MKGILSIVILFLLVFGCVQQTYDEPGEEVTPVEEPNGITEHKYGCEYDNPPCDEDYDCIRNECILKSGCAHDNPLCEESYTCINNSCILKEGCAYSNPSCGEGYSCINNECVQHCPYECCEDSVYKSKNCGVGYLCNGNECISDPAYKGDGTYLLRLEDRVIVDNGVGIKFVGVYDVVDDYSTDKGIALDFYIGNKRINPYTRYYKLKQADLSYFEQSDTLELIDYGLRITLDKTKVTDDSIEITIESYEEGPFTDCSQLYDICLNKEYDERYEYAAPLSCLRYCADMEKIEGYKTAKDDDFLIIAHDYYEQETVNRFLNYSKFVYGNVRDHLGFEPVHNKNIAIYIGDRSEGVNSVSRNEGIHVVAQNDPDLYTSDVWHTNPLTDLTHEMLHFFRNPHFTPSELEEGYVTYNDVLIRNKLDPDEPHTLECGETEVCLRYEGVLGKWGACHPYDISYYPAAACFWKELNESYPETYASISRDMRDKRLILSNELYCIGDIIKEDVSDEFYAYLKEKYLNQIEGVSGGESCGRIYSGAPFANYWD